MLPTKFPEEPYLLKIFVELGYNNLAKQYNDIVQSDYSKSIVNDYCSFEMLKLYINEENSDSVINYNKRLQRSIVEDSIKAEANILLSDFYLKKGDIKTAIIILDNVADNVSQYKTAQMKRILISDAEIPIKTIKTIFRENTSYLTQIKVIHKLLKIENLEFFNKLLMKYDVKEINEFILIEKVRVNILKKEWDKCIALLDLIDDSACIKDLYFHKQFLISQALIGKTNNNDAIMKLNQINKEILDYKLTLKNEKGSLSQIYPTLKNSWSKIGDEIDSLMNLSRNSYVIARTDSLQPTFEETYSQIKRYNELVRDAYKKKYDPFNLDILHEDVKKTLRELEENMEKSKR